MNILHFNLHLILHFTFYYTVFNKGLDESDKKQGPLKRLKNIEGKNKDQLDQIEYQGERQLDAIEKQGKKNLEAINKQKKRLQKITNQEIKMEEKPERTVLLRDKLNDILADYGMNINAEAEYILKKTC